MKSGFAFLVILILSGGSLWILGLELNNFSAAIVCTLSAMVGYIVWIFWRERRRKDYEKYADSVYYLGFMLTLIALLVALWGMGSAETSLIDLVQKFGLGLSTTLLGLAGRIWMLEFGKNPEEIQKEVTIKLQESAQDLSLQLHQGQRILKNAYEDLSKQALEQQSVITNLVRETAQEFSIEIKSITSEIRKSAEETAIHIGTVTSNSAKELEGSAKAMIDAMKGNADKLHGVFSEEMALIQGTLKSFRAAVNGIRIPPDLFEKKLTSAMEGARKSFEKLDAVVTAGTAAATGVEVALKATKSSAAEAAAYFSEVKQTAEALSTTKEQIISLTIAISNFDAGLQKLENRMNDQIAQQITSTSQLQEIYAEQVRAVKELREKLEEDIKASTHAVNQVHEELTRNARFIVDKLGA